MGGMMALTDVFCRINRARSLELLSPEDILNACKLMESLDLPLKLFEFSSGVKVLQLTSLDTETVAEATAVLVRIFTKEITNKFHFAIYLIDYILDNI